MFCFISFHRYADGANTTTNDITRMEASSHREEQTTLENSLM